MLRPFRAWHIGWIKDKGLPVGGWIDPSEELLFTLEKHNSWTAIGDEGEPIACGGTVQIWPGRHSAWAYMGPITGPHMVAITRYALECLEKAKGRIEMTVRVDFEAGHRWAKMLGFKVETPVMPFYGPDGEAHSSYVRIN